MLFSRAARAIAMAVVPALSMLAMAPGVAEAFDQTKYPDLGGQWRRAETGTFRFDQSKPWGPGQEAPLTPEYQSIFEANLASQASGGQGVGVTYTCASPGMPRVVNGYGPMEFVVTPESTHILVENIYDSRRIFTDGRTWPEQIEPSMLGYSIGKWIDADGDGRFDDLEVETRGSKGRALSTPAAFRCTRTIRPSSRNASSSTRSSRATAAKQIRNRCGSSTSATRTTTTSISAMRITWSARMAC
jgi:hypothetical protein